MGQQRWDRGVTYTWWLLGLAVKAPQLGPGDMHIVAVRLGCQSAVVGTE